MWLGAVIATILLVPTKSEAVHRGQFGKLSWEFQDHIVLETGYQQFSAICSVSECFSLCTKDIHCQSFFYRRNDSICYLHSIVYSSDAHWFLSPGTQYVVLNEENCSSYEGFVFHRVTKLCYKIHTETKVKWPDARQVCIAERGDLISLDTIQKYYHIVATIRASPELSNTTNGLFIGGLNDLPGGDWRWLSNATLKIDSPMWGAGLPGSDDDTLRYLRISNLAEQGLDDTPINERYFFICEIFI